MNREEELIEAVMAALDKEGLVDQEWTSARPCAERIAAHIALARSKQAGGVEAYSADQQRACDYLQQIAPDIGCGLDPVGFLIASHAALASPLTHVEGWKPTEAEKLRLVVVQMVEAVKAGCIDSPWRDGEPEVGIPPSQFHEEWMFHAEAALAAAPEPLRCRG